MSGPGKKAAIPNERITYLPDTINALKGILILFIIVGHNLAISYNYPTLVRIFYYFNVQCFFVLAFILNNKPFSIELLRDRAVRYLTPYLVFMTMSAAIWMLLIVRRIPDGFLSWIRIFALALYNGNERTILAAVGMQVFWFLPSLFSLVMLRSLCIRHEALYVPFVIAGTVWMGSVALLSPRILSWLPLGLSPALFFFNICLFTHWVTSRTTSANERFVTATAIGSTATLTFLIIIIPLNWVRASIPGYYNLLQPAEFIVGIIFPITMYPSLLYAAKLLRRNHLLALCGKYSLSIFLIHMFIYRALCFAVFGGKQFANFSIVGSQLEVGLLLFVITLFVSLGISVAIARLPWLNNLIFPRDWDCLRQRIKSYFNANNKTYES